MVACSDVGVPIKTELTVPSPLVVCRPRPTAEAEAAATCGSDDERNRSTTALQGVMLRTRAHDAPWTRRRHRHRCIVWRDRRERGAAGRRQGQQQRCCHPPHHRRRHGAHTAQPASDGSGGHGHHPQGPCWLAGTSCAPRARVRRAAGPLRALRSPFFPPAVRPVFENTPRVHGDQLAVTMSWTAREEGSTTW